jgi:hypothetical protein
MDGNQHIAPFAVRRIPASTWPDEVFGACNGATHPNHQCPLACGDDA